MRLAASIAALALLAAVAGCRDGSGPRSDAAHAVDGLNYRSLLVDGAVVHTIRLDLKRVRLRVADARRPGRKTAEVRTLAHETGALAALNGTFFDERQRPLGLLVSDGRELNPLRDVSWWAALVVREDGGRASAEILTTEQLRRVDATERSRWGFALQVGPRTVADGRPIRLKQQFASRSAVCVRRPDEIVLIATEGAPMEANALAALMARDQSDGGLGCRSGLMFDGGPSTQLFASAGPIDVDLRGGWGVPNALVVVPEQEQ